MTELDAISSSSSSYQEDLAPTRHTQSLATATGNRTGTKAEKMGLIEAVGGAAPLPVPSMRLSSEAGAEASCDPDPPPLWAFPRPRRLETTNTYQALVRHRNLIVVGFVILLFVVIFIMLHAHDLRVDPYQAEIAFAVWLLIGLVIVATAQTIHITVRYVCG